MFIVDIPEPSRRGNEGKKEEEGRDGTLVGSNVTTTAPHHVIASTVSKKLPVYSSIYVLHILQVSAKS